MRLGFIMILACALTLSYATNEEFFEGGIVLKVTNNVGI